MTKSNLDKRIDIQHDLQDYFRKACPSLHSHIHVYSFGSMTNGFGFKNSDLDYFVKGISIITAQVSSLQVDV